MLLYLARLFIHQQDCLFAVAFKFLQCVQLSFSADAAGAMCAEWTQRTQRRRRS